MGSSNVKAKALRVAAALTCLAGLTLIRTSDASAQQSEDLQHQVKQLKQEYEQVIADLQKRIAALEQKTAEQKTTATSAEKYSVTAQQAAQEMIKPVEGNKRRMRKVFRNKPLPIPPTFN